MQNHHGMRSAHVQPQSSKSTSAATPTIKPNATLANKRLAETLFAALRRAQGLRKPRSIAERFRPSQSEKLHAFAATNRRLTLA
jgi:hypothetical protein